jgi:hypothetical protein
MMSCMTHEEKNTFLLDVTIIDWYDYFLMYNYGLHRFVLNENVEPPVSADILANKKLSYFSDIQWAL